MSLITFSVAKYFIYSQTVHTQPFAKLNLANQIGLQYYKFAEVMSGTITNFYLFFHKYEYYTPIDPQVTINNIPDCCLRYFILLYLTLIFMHLFYIREFVMPACDILCNTDVALNDVSEGV